MMRVQSAHSYIKPMNDVTEEFIQHIRNIRDKNNEVPENFQHELYKWALESK